MRPREGPSARALGLAGAGCAALIASQGFGTAALATLGAGLVALPIIVTALVWAVAEGSTCAAGSSRRACRRATTSGSRSP